jgi:hypothetical protein
LIQIKRLVQHETHNRSETIAGTRPDRETTLNGKLHQAAPHYLPFFAPGADGSDTLIVVMGIFLVATVLWVGTLYWKLHSLPERMAHKTHKLQFEIVAVLGLISLFTHMHIFWVAGLLLAMIDLPDFGTPMASIAASVGRIADASPRERRDRPDTRDDDQAPPPPTPEPQPKPKPKPGLVKEHSHV